MKMTGGALLACVLFGACAEPVEITTTTTTTRRESTTPTTSETTTTEATTTTNRQDTINDDVTLLSCQRGEYGWMEAQLQIVNDSEDRSNYSIEVAFESPDGTVQFDTGYASVSGLAPGQTATENAITTTEVDGEFRCLIIDVSRYSAEP